ncbi:hypothetical protein [Prosthecobacter sp.]|uniref:hypothetical protein n=1 Tax=Prosthecobacter sp. TaxID=1965333 RepID=UPI002ABAAD2E|nr:hypothetical protein [Prosthecobacter sp.]MDZ4401882.1 hypothetical protein [Prosthecobacter sp.]
MNTTLHTITLGFILGGAMAGASGQSTGGLAKVESIPTQTSAWQLAWADLERDGKDEIIYASYRGILTCQDLQSGRVKWSHDLEGLPFAIKTADLDGDGKLEVIAASASLSVFALTAEGGLLWRHRGTAPLYAIAAGHLLDRKAMHVAVGGEDMTATLLDSQGKVVKQIPYVEPPDFRRRLRVMDAGDTDGDGLDELLLVNGFDMFSLYDPRSGKAIWNLRGKDSGKGNLTSGMLIDLDGSGRCIAYVGSRKSVFAVDGKGTMLWEARLDKTAMGCEQIALAPVDLDGDGKLDLAAQLGSRVFGLDRSGAVRFTSDTSYFVFNGIAGAPGPASRQVMLASVTGADRNVHRVTFGAGSSNGITAFMDPPGYRDEINNTLRAIRDQVQNLPVDAQTAKRPYTVAISGGSPGLTQLPRWAETQAKCRAAYPYDNISYYAYLALQEEGFETTQAMTYPVSELLKFADAAESSKCLHVLIVGHGHHPAMAPGTVNEWLKRTPTSCLGILFSELNVSVFHLPRFERNKPEFDRFIDESFFPIIDVAVKHRKPTHLMMKQNWWAYTPAMQNLGQRLLSPERRAWIIPSVEESAATTPEINLMAMAGLWRSGLVKSWKANIIDDQLVVNAHLTEWKPSDAHHMLRHLVASAALGANCFKSEGFFPDRQNKYDFQDAPMNPTLFGVLSRDIFIHLLGKGLLDVPTPDTISGLSPVVFRFDEPSLDFLQCDNHAVSEPPPQIPEASARGLFTGNEWAFVQTRPHFAPRYLLGIDRHAHAFMPTNHHGLPTIVPSWFSLPAGGYGKQQFHTDGVDVMIEGARRSAAEMQPAIASAFAATAEQLPVRATHCFWMGTRRADGVIRLTLVDSPYVDPVGVEAELMAIGPIQSLRDVIANQPIPFTGTKAKLAIPAGAFRIVDVKLSAP